MADNPPPTITPPPVSSLSPEEKNTRQWNMFCHLAALSGFVGVPFGSVLGPLLVWQIKKNEIPSVIVHGKAALNFQLTVLIGMIASFMVGFVLLAVCIGVLFLILAGLIALCGLIFAVIAGISANDGKEYKYPWSLTLVN